MLFRSTASEYTISLDPCGGSVETDGLLVVPGNPYGALPIPTRPGYAFLGWFTGEEDGTQKISLDKPSGNSTLYAHWLPRSERNLSGAWLEWSSTNYNFPKYITALSKLMAQMGQQCDSDFDPETCYEYLKATDMIGTSSGAEVVRTSKYTETGFLEYYAPEFTYHGSVSPEDYEDEESYYAELSDLYEANYGLLIKLFVDEDKTSTCWRTVARVAGGEVYILDETSETTASEAYYGFSNVHAFQFHGEAESSDLRIIAYGEYSTQQNHTGLSCVGQVSLEPPTDGASSLTPGTSCFLLAAGYSDAGSMVGAFLQPFTVTAEPVPQHFSFSVGNSFALCRAFILNDCYQPLCEEPDMDFLSAPAFDG